MSVVEVAVRVSDAEIIVELADWIVRVEFVPMVFHVEAAAPVKLRAVSDVMLAEPMVIVDPIVVVPTYKLRHLKLEEPKLYAASE